MGISFCAERYITDLEGEWPATVGIGTVCYAMDTGCFYGWSGAEWIKVPPHHATPTPSAGIMSDVNGQIDTGWLGSGTPDSGKFLRGDKVWATPPSGGGAPTDASYVTIGLDATLSAERTLAGEASVVSIGDGGAGGNVTVSIANDGISNAKLANVAQNTIKGRITTGTGDPEDLTAANVRSIINVADGANAYSHPNHSGDVTSVGDGAQTIANGAVSNAKSANMAQNAIKGRISAGAGAPEDLSAANVRTIINVADGANAYVHPNHSGDVTSVADGAQTIANNTVSFAKMADIATDRLIGRDTAATGDPEALTVGGGLEFTGSGGIQRSALSGDVAATAGSGTTAIGTDVVTNAKLANMAANSLKGNNTGGAADPLDLTATQATAMLDVFTSGANGLVPASGGGTTNFLRADGSFAAPPGGGGGAPTDAEYIVGAANGTLTAERVATSTTSITADMGTAGQAQFKRAALTGDVTASADSNSTTIATNAVSYAKMQDVAAASRLLGRGSLAGAGDPEEITLGTNLSMSGTTLNAAGGGGGAAMLIVPFQANAAGAATWTNMPAAETFFGGSHRNVTKVDLTNFTQVRLVVSKQTTAGAAASILYVKYRTAFDTTVGNYSAIGVSAVSVAVNVQNTVLVSSWIDLAAGAKADVFVALAGSGGDGVLDPQFGNMSLQCR